MFKANLHIQVIGPDIDDLQVIEPSPLPGRRLVLPLRLEPLERGGRQWHPLALQPSERQLEIGERQAVQMHLGGTAPSPV